MSEWSKTPKLTSRSVKSVNATDCFHCSLTVVVFAAVAVVLPFRLLLRLCLLLGLFPPAADEQLCDSL